MAPQNRAVHLRRNAQEVFKTDYAESIQNGEFDRVGRLLATTSRAYFELLGLMIAKQLIWLEDREKACAIVVDRIREYSISSSWSQEFRDWYQDVVLARASNRAFIPKPYHDFPDGSD